MGSNSSLLVLEFLDPIFSSGVTIALHSAQLASALLVRQLRAEIGQPAHAQQCGGVRRRARPSCGLHRGK